MPSLDALHNASVGVEPIEGWASQPRWSSELPEPGFRSPALCYTGEDRELEISGYAAAGPDTRYFYWLFKSRSKPAVDPLVIWLSGGPGCSSMLALLAENGPCTVPLQGGAASESSRPPLQANPGGWNERANVVWVDQPAGVGFSTGPLVHDEVGVAEAMYSFLQSFFQEHAELRAVPLFIFGESYAGHYVPAIAHEIWRRNQDAAGAEAIALRGVAIGNGLTNPSEQYRWYPTMARTGAREYGGHAPSGTVDEKTYRQMERAKTPCVEAIAMCNAGVDVRDGRSHKANAFMCVWAWEYCNTEMMGPVSEAGKNPYDLREKCQAPPMCYNFSNVEAFLNDAQVQTALGVEAPFELCSRAVYDRFVAAGDWMINYHSLLPDLLHDGIEVLVYAGDTDYTCNWIGNKEWTKKLEWRHQAEFQKAPDRSWPALGGVRSSNLSFVGIASEPEPAARLRSAAGLHFMQIHDAGHMLPMDKPEVSLRMVNEFISGRLGVVAETGAQMAEGPPELSARRYCLAVLGALLGACALATLLSRPFCRASGPALRESLLEA